MPQGTAREVMVRAQDYMMVADLTGGVLTLEGTNKASRFGLDASRSKRMSEAVEAHRGNDIAARRAVYQEICDQQVPRIRVSEIERVRLKDPTRLVNGRMDVAVGDLVYHFAFLRKTQDEVHALFEALVHAIEESRTGPAAETEGTAAQPPPPSAPPGWYPDPDQDALQRYWDGSQWTEHTAPRGQ